MISLLHLCNDEKFIDMAIDQFERLHNVKSVFVVCSRTSLKYVKSRNVVILDENEKILNFVERNPCDFVVLHSLYVALVDVSRDSFAYKHYTSMGCKVFCIEEDIMNGDMFDVFDERLKLNNKMIIEKDLNPTRYKSQLQSFFDELQ